MMTGGGAFVFKVVARALLWGLCSPEASGRSFKSYAERTVCFGDEVEFVAVVPPGTSAGGARGAAHPPLAGDAPPDDVDARVVRGARRVRVAGGGRPALAVGLVRDDRASVGDGLLRREGREAPRDGARPLGLLHGSPARLRVPLRGARRLRAGAPGDGAPEPLPRPRRLRRLHGQLVPRLRRDGALPHQPRQARADGVPRRAGRHQLAARLLRHAPDDEGASLRRRLLLRRALRPRLPHAARAVAQRHGAAPPRRTHPPRPHRTARSSVKLGAGCWVLVKTLTLTQHPAPSTQ